MNVRQSFALLCVVFTLVCLSPVPADSQLLAQKRFMKSPPVTVENDEGPREFIRPSGLVPSFSRDAACPAIVSAFGSTTRYDGSRRPMDRFAGLHGGIDLTLDEKTPLLAIAAGRIIHMGVGDIAEGNYLWLQHAPEDTGLPFWIYTKYQHLYEVPKRAAGEKVGVGEVVALSGSTGTKGGHYGARGYPHLHLTTVASPSDKYARKESRIIAESARFFDPVAIYIRGLKDLGEIDRLSDDRKILAIPYLAENASIHPAGSLVVWPVSCRSK